MTASASCLFDYFSSVPDPRRQRGNYRYPLDELLFLTISGVISGLEDWVHIAEFGYDQLDWLRKFMPFKHGIPSHDTLGSVFSSLESQAFNKAFIAWTQALSQRSEGQIVSIDGKQLCGSYDHSNNKSAIHLVSAFACQNGLSLGQVKTSEKSNEITAIFELLNLIALQGFLVTIDAMGCQLDIACQIRQREAHYLLALKSNKGSLYEQVVKAFDVMPLWDSDEQLELDHGRVEKRSCQIINDFRFVEEVACWPDIASIGTSNQ